MLRELLRRILDHDMKLPLPDLVAVRTCAEQLRAVAAGGGVDRGNRSTTLANGNGNQAVNSNKRTLFRAIKRRDITKTTRLLDRGDIDVDTEDESGETPLHAAAAAGSLELVTVLVDRGADREARNRSNHTPLYALCNREVWPNTEDELEIWNLLLNQPRPNFGTRSTIDLRNLLYKIVKSSPHNFLESVLPTIHDIDIRPRYRYTLLEQLCCDSAAVDKSLRVRMLLNCGARPDLPTMSTNAVDLAFSCVVDTEYEIRAFRPRVNATHPAPLPPRIPPGVIQICYAYFEEVRTLLALVAHVVTITAVQTIPLNDFSRRDQVYESYFFEGLRDFCQLPPSEALARLRQRVGVVLTEIPADLYEHICRFQPLLAT